MTGGEDADKEKGGDQVANPEDITSFVGGTASEAVLRLTRGALCKVTAALKDTKDLAAAKDVWGGVEDLLSACALLVEENRVLRGNTDELVGQIEATRERLQRAMGDIDTLSMVATFDNLTGLLSKNAFTSYMPEYFKSHEKEGRIFSFLMMDGDGFKNINDNYGHAAGDYVLTELGNLARKCFRLGDFGFRGGAEGKYTDNGAGVRFGGDEFCFVLADTGAKDSLIAAERFKKMVDDHKFIYEGEELKIGVSIGVSEVDYDKDKDWNAVAKRADAALYTAKESGKGKVVEWVEGMEIKKRRNKKRPE